MRVAEDETGIPLRRQCTFTATCNIQATASEVCGKLITTGYLPFEWACSWGHAMHAFRVVDGLIALHFFGDVFIAGSFEDKFRSR